MMTSAAASETYKIVSENVAYHRYVTVFDRKVEFPAHPTDRGRNREQPEIHSFDVVGHPSSRFTYVTIMAMKFSEPEPQVTLVHEFCQGPGAPFYNVPMGAVCSEKHGGSLEAAVRAELSEEAHLRGGELVRLLDSPNAMPELKWSVNRFQPFLVINPEADPTPLPRDAEESTMIVANVSLSDLRNIIFRGEMLPNSIATVALALNYLKNSGRCVDVLI